MSTHRQWAQLLDAVSRPDAGHDCGDLLRQALGLGSDVAPETVGCSVTEIVGSRYSTPAFSGSLALDLDRAQYQSGDGPCMTAAREQQHQHFDATTDQGRFPGFTEVAIEQGVRSSVSLPLIGVARPSAINLYGSSRHAFDGERPRAVASLLARCVSALLAEPRLAAGSAPVPASEIEAAQARASVLARAQAALVSRQQLSQTAAFDILTGRSRAEGRSIFEVARDVVTADGTEQTR